MINEIDEITDKITKEISLTVSFKEKFYPEYKDEIEDIQLAYLKLSNEWIGYFKSIKKALEEKKSNLFETIESIEIQVPSDFYDIQNQYNKLMHANNKSNLIEMKEDAKNKLRFHKIKMYLEKFEYDSKYRDLLNIENTIKKYQENLENEKSKIFGNSGIDYQIEIIKKKIDDLRLQTKDEKKLAENINTKLESLVTFKLEHVSSNGKEGHYQVICERTNEIRKITQLSTGEKNIIAFLYFIEKLNEVSNNTNSNTGKIILFDDPMNSNDDTMQYTIIEELHKLMNNRNIKDKIIILTHNCHFYINLKYKIDYKTNNFIRLISKNKKTYISYITDGKKDFKTSYEFLWKELKLLNLDENLHPESLLNPIRRIIETYTKFNGIKPNTFYGKVSGSKKLFNVNSHSIDDFEADLNGKTKDQIIEIFRNCFEQNNAIEHFNLYWLD